MIVLKLEAVTWFSPATDVGRFGILKFNGFENCHKGSYHRNHFEDKIS